MDARGTFAIDLMFATFMILIMVGTMSFLALDRFNMVDESQDLAEARSLAENIAGTINRAYAGGDGHAIEINMPAQINHDNNYRVLVNSSGVLIRLEGRRGLAYSIPEKISASVISLKSSTVTMSPTKNYIIINKKDGNGENWIVIEEK